MSSKAKNLKGAVAGLAGAGRAESAKQRTLFSYFSKTVSPSIKEKNTVTENNSSDMSQKRDDYDTENAKNTETGPRKKFKTGIEPLVQAQESRLAEKSKVLKIVDQNIGLSWFLALETEFDKDYFKTLNDFVENARRNATVYPPPSHVWEWTRHCSIRDIKVVILGQDPYHGPGQAHGLCFSVRNVAPPPSLINMYKELEADIGQDFNIPKHGCLVGWAQQGVLLLNSVLTVTAGQPNSHKDRGWEKLTDATISWISANLNSVVFLLWGAYAQKKAAIVDKKKHHLLQTAHPSPLSCHRGFFGCKHFSKCNEILKANGKKSIDWNHLPNI